MESNQTVKILDMDAKSVSRAKAREMYDNGFAIYMHPSSLSVGNPWGLVPTTYQKDSFNGRTFEQLADSFKMFMCNDSIGKNVKFFATLDDISRFHELKRTNAKYAVIRRMDISTRIDTFHTKADAAHFNGINRKYCTGQSIIVGFDDVREYIGTESELNAPRTYSVTGDCHARMGERFFSAKNKSVNTL